MDEITKFLTTTKTVEQAYLDVLTVIHNCKVHFNKWTLQSTGLYTSNQNKIKPLIDCVTLLVKRLNWSDMPESNGLGAVLSTDQGQMTFAVVAKHIPKQFGGYKGSHQLARLNVDQIRGIIAFGLPRVNSPKLVELINKDLSEFKIIQLN